MRFLLTGNAMGGSSSVTNIAPKVSQNKINKTPILNFALFEDFIYLEWQSGLILKLSSSLCIKAL
jgi:hypothetical protein